MGADQSGYIVGQELELHRHLPTRSILGSPNLGQAAVLVRLARHGPEKNTTDAGQKKKKRKWLRPVKSTIRDRQLFPSPILSNA
jgi:hypothetical protein